MLRSQIITLFMMIDHPYATTDAPIGEAVMVVNTHIWWNTKSPDVQFAQAECALKAIDAHLENDVAVLFCGS